jgi:hypothetical protein
VRRSVEKVNTRAHRVTRRAAGRDARRGTRPAAPGPGRAAHRRVRGHPDGAGQHADGDVRGRAVLGPAPPAGSPRCGSACRAVGADEQVVIVHVGADGPVEVARHAGPPLAARRSTTGTSRPPGRGRWSGTPGPAPPRRRSSSPWARVPGCGWRGRRRGHHQDAGQDDRGPRAGQAVRPRRGRLGPGTRRGARPVRRGRPVLDPGPPPHHHDPAGAGEHRASEDDR